MAASSWAAREASSLSASRMGSCTNRGCASVPRWAAMLRRHWSEQFRAMVRIAQSCMRGQHQCDADVAPDDLRWLHTSCCATSCCAGNATMRYLAAAHNSHRFKVQNNPILNNEVLLAAFGPATAHSAPNPSMSQPTPWTLDAVNSVCCPAHGPQRNMMVIKVMTGVHPLHAHAHVMFSLPPSPPSPHPPPATAEEV